MFEKKTTEHSEEIESSFIGGASDTNPKNSDERNGELQKYRISKEDNCGSNNFNSDKYSDVFKNNYSKQTDDGIKSENSNRGEGQDKSGDTKQGVRTEIPRTPDKSSCDRTPCDSGERKMFEDNSSLEGREPETETTTPEISGSCGNGEMKNNYKNIFNEFWEKLNTESLSKNIKNFIIIKELIPLDYLRELVKKRLDNIPDYKKNNKAINWLKNLLDIKN